MPLNCATLKSATTNVRLLVRLNAFWFPAQQRKAGQSKHFKAEAFSLIGTIFSVFKSIGE